VPACAEAHPGIGCDHAAMKLRDDRFLFGLTPSVFFPLWAAAGVAVSALIEDWPLWPGLLVAVPVGWSMPVYVLRMPVFRRPPGDEGQSTS